MEDNDTANKLLDVRREQRLCYRGVFLLSACVLPVPAHVNAAVRCFLVSIEIVLYAEREI